LTAAIASNSSWNEEGLRRYDARRDMAALADLIETAFGARLDDSGRRMIQEMRWLGKAGWLGWLLSRWLLPPAAHPYGFVWEIDGEVIGNASLLPVEHFSHRWVIANVAVAPEHRGQGIAGRLVDASVEFACRKGSRQLILQVDADNQRALTLYQHKGFTKTTTRTVWAAHRTPQALDGIDTRPVRKRDPEEWRSQWALAKRLHPEGVIWPYPTVSTIFRPSGARRWFSVGPDRHWVWFEDGQLIGSSSLRYSSQPGILRILLVVEPEFRGKIEAALLSAAMKGLQHSQWGFLLEYPQGAADEILREVGFRAQRTLTWMSKTFHQTRLHEKN
jgi:ribosomal protein S18 acetylase RimI-like enzyme